MMNRRKEYIEGTELQTQERVLSFFYNKDDKFTIFEIGACEGENSIRYSNLFPKSHIFAFEPLPDNIELVKRNISQYDKSNIQLITTCLSDKRGELTFYVSSGKPDNIDAADWNFGNKSSSILPPEKTLEVHDWLKFNKEIKVEADTLENFCTKRNIAKIDFIHMDVQGAELLVLQGAGDYIKRIGMIWLEVEAVELYRGQPLKGDIEKYLDANGFTKIADTVYAEAGDQFWANESYGYSLFKLKLLKVYYGLKYSYKKIRRKLLN